MIIGADLASMAFFIEGLVCYSLRWFSRFLLVETEAEAIGVETEAVDEITASTSLALPLAHNIITIVTTETSKCLVLLLQQ